MFFGFFPLPIKNLPNSFEKLNNKEFNLFSGNKSLIEANEKERQFLNAMISMYSKNNLKFELPDISKWDTSNVTNMSFMFSDCIFLTHLPDISKWNTSNITNMESIFQRCISLVKLPDISVWNISNVSKLNNIFFSCLSLEFFAKYFKTEY